MPNALLERLKTKKSIIGMQCFTGSAALVEIMGYSGFDWVSIDMEHTTISFADVENLTRAAQVSGMIPLVRVAENDPLLIGKALDCGAAGVIVPHIQSAADLKKALAAARFFPEGERGKCGQVRGSRYGADGVPWSKFWKQANDDVIVLPLVEEKEGIEALDEILAVDGVDVLWIGIGDLAQSYNVPGAPMTQEPLLSAARGAIAKARAVGKVLLAPSSPTHTHEYCRELLDMGFVGISYGTDTSIFRNVCRDAISLTK
ncbi:aldolase/citrate lyase family protein [Aminobacter sp. AP02]|uniref:HpcH/HpaI aldolase family protein n=1 Tax=Aminobacter sp. AP02 TaxID=2135737 RepID=UPI000D6CCFB0|nr:aldolase/citrate lyase family protein [Aminobacter sp. AP02]PWK61286.1 4-hydroxy-2-oxoheptanedioate aldolase [Aminobacter sp. AP02]